MQTGRPSLTAYRVAMIRAVHQLVDAPLLLDDPLALRIIGEEGRQRLETNRRRYSGSFAKHVRLIVVLRSRVAEDALETAAQAGVTQYVVLGAGLDTSAYRIAQKHPQVRSFEVDYAATQSWKRKLLRDANIALPPSLSFVSVDFETESWTDALVRAGFDPTRPACVSWLGVTYYLTDAAFTATIAAIGRMPRGTSVVFDYFPTRAAMNWLARIIYWRMSRRVAAIGEPWLSQFAPGEIPRRLRAAGFTDVEEFGARELSERYCSGEGRRFRLRTIARIARATV